MSETISVEEAARILGTGRDAVRAGIRDGNIPSIRVGKHIRIPLPSFKSLLSGESKLDESEIARQIHLMSLRSELERLNAVSEVLVRQIADIEKDCRPNGFTAYLEAAR
ncbi:MAG: excisionase family DNA-binding protein [Armatimonadota bacterium]|nr:excisionase family DNA-binding protein [bacterium]